MVPAQRKGSTKKRKRGPSTLEKKKEKKRIKRAENNRKLGVKRLKLQPVLKEKKIVYRRHYLQGRCHEGDKCKFSHDTIPLTKSQPCVHFARHSCMKGDDCPFDHQLSNYPCANFASNGFCNRGSECLFSHKIPAKSCTITPNVPKHNVMSAQPTPSRNHMDNYRILHQKVEAILSPASNSPAKGVELPSGKSVPRTGGKPPRGVSFLSNKGKSVIDTVKEKQDGSSTKKPDTVGIGETATLKVSSCISKLTAASEGAAPREKPRGINFLSFGQPSMDNSSHEKFSNLFSNCNSGTGKSVMKEGNLMPQSSGILNVHRQTNKSAAKLASGLSEKVNRTPQTVSQHVNFLSFNRSHLDDSISKETANLHFSKGDNSSNSDKDKASTSKLQHTIKSPPSLPFGGLWDQSTVGKHANLSSSFKKSLFSNTPSLVQKAVQSTLSFAAKLENDIRVGPSHHR